MIAAQSIWRKSFSLVFHIGSHVTRQRTENRYAASSACSRVALPRKTWTPPPIQAFSAKPANSMKTKPMAKAVVRQLEPLLTIDDVARVCKVSVKTVRRWIESGELRAAKLGAQWRIRPKDLELFIADRVR